MCDLARTGAKVLEASEVKRSFVREPQTVSSWKVFFSVSLLKAKAKATLKEAGKLIFLRDRHILIFFVCE